ncbi:hypothetical protein K1719_033968 [Acacia pycnantha]|nr:hypothetical protein K1719_033968 [Acacia pycnantha]
MEKKPSENADKDEENNAGETSHHHASSEPGNPDDEAIAENDDHAQADSVTEGETTDVVPTVALTPAKLSADVDSWIETMLHQRNADITEIPDCVDKFLDLFEENIVSYDAVEGRPKWVEVPEQDSSFLESASRIRKLSEVLSQSQCSSQHINERKDSLVNRIGVMRQGAMSYLEEVFRMLLEKYRNQNKGEIESSGHHDLKVEQDNSALSDSEHSDFPGFSEVTITSLNKIAKEMILSGYESECCQVYIISRRNAFEERLNELGFEKISIDEIQKLTWESLEDEIPTWIKTFKECARNYFPGELKLVESVFKEHPSIGDGLYCNLTRGVVIQLLNFAEGVAMTKRSVEKLFKFLDMCETLGVVISGLNLVLTEERGGELMAETASARNRLGEAAISILSDLENSIKAEAGKAVPGGAVHPLTRYLMNYLPLACEYKDTLDLVFKEHTKLQGDSTGGSHQHHQENDHGYDGKEESPFAEQMMRVMELLDASLEGKAKLYKDVSLACIFMMNNGRYILQKIKGSSVIYQLLGNTWCRKKSSDLRAQHKNYQRESWGKILRCLNPEGLSVNGKLHKPYLKERFKSFNAMFDELLKTQSSWIVYDEQLQSELRVSVAGLVIPAYRAFVGRFSQNLTPGRQTEKYIKYQPEDIENYIDNLFSGNPQFMSKRKLV